MSAKDYRKGAIPYHFVAVPKLVLASGEYIALPPSAKALLFDLTAQYTGKNNGRLCPNFEVMKRDRGWTSKHTLLRAKRALLACSWALQTRIGHPPRTSEWMGFTWWKLDYEPTMEISPRAWPYLNFATALSVVPKQRYEARKSAPGSAKTAPMTASPDRKSVV